MRRRFEEDLLKLKYKLAEMAEMCHEALDFAIDDFLNATTNNHSQILEIEEKINRLEQEIENDCIRFIIQQQPVAKDLRNVSSLLKMITDIERIGDQACDISNLTKITNLNYAPDKEAMTEMANIVKEMLDKAIRSVRERSLNLAKEVIDLDEKVDTLYLDIKRDIIEYIKNEHHDEEEVIDILIVAKYFERIADHSTNIAEWITFYLTGHHE